MLRIGAIGCGDIAQRRHFPQLEALRGAAELVAIAARDPARLAACADRFNVPGRYSRAEAMLASADIDAVLVLTPPDTHAHYAEMAVRAGKHVMVEKPLVRTLAEAVRLSQAVREASPPITFYALPHVETAEQRLIARLLADGAIGQPTLIDSHRGHRGPTHADWFYRRTLAGGGVLLDLGIYQLSQIAALFGPATSMTVTCLRQFPTRTMDDGRVIEPDVEDLALLTLHLAGGMTASVNANWNGCLSHHATRARSVVIGREGMLHFGVADGAVYLFRPNARYPLLPEAAGEAAFDGLACHRYVPQAPPGIANLVAEFVARIAAGDTGTRSLDIQHHVMEIIARAYDPAVSTAMTPLASRF